MKTFILSLLMVAGLAAGANAQNGAVLKLNTESHDFGSIPQGVPATYTFTVTNTGTEDLILANVKPSCGCTVPEYSTEPIAPGKTGTIKATFNAAKEGPFSKAITITSNSATPSKVIFIKGNVQAAPSNDGVPTKPSSIVNQ